MTQKSAVQEGMNDGNQDELLDLEMRYWQAIKDRDVETAVSLSHEPCVVTGPQGVGRLERAALSHMMSNAGYTLDDFAFRDSQVLFVNDDVAIVAYKVHEELTVDGEKVTLDASEASTWIRRDGHWLCALHTEAVAGDPFGRDRLRQS